MPFRWNPREHLALGTYVLKWLLIALPVGAVIGSASALFLFALDWATRTRWDNPWLLFLLPVAGAAIAGIYELYGRTAEGGNNLIIDQIHKPGAGVPLRMAPLVLLGTIATHLYGGSAGREGTAVQMGGSIAGGFGRLLRFDAKNTRTLLMAGVAAGFGAVFGTPLTGAVFAIEVLALGHMDYGSIIPCLIASIVGDWSCTAWGTRHTVYHLASFSGMGLITAAPRYDWLLVAKVAAAAVAFGLVSVLFAEMTHSIQRVMRNLVPWPIVRPIIGGVAIIALVYLLGTRDYLGIGDNSPNPHAVTILSAFNPGGAQPWSWWWKLLFTAVTVGCAFKGGEVTPLFFIGATLGNTLGWVMGAPVDLFAGLGFLAVFAGAANTPLACTIMGIELFGSGHVVYMAMACFLAYFFSGHSGIYLSQRIGTPKLLDIELPPDASLRTARELNPRVKELAGRVMKRFGVRR